MRKSKVAEAAFLEVFQQRKAEGNPDVYGLQLVEEANQLPVDPPRLHKLGNTVLRLMGKEEREYRPNYTYQLYTALHRLEDQGLVTSDWEDEPKTPGGPRRRQYRLVNPKEY